MTGVNYLSIIFYFLTVNPVSISCTIDVNLAELEYLAAHLDPFECRRLVAALHYTTYELPKSLEGAGELKDDISNINSKDHTLYKLRKKLLHWNMSANEGKGKTHEEIEHRLRQLNKNDLADWLGKETFKQLGKDLERAIERPFEELEEHQTETSYPITPMDEPDEEDPWIPVDTFMVALFVISLATLLVLIGAIVIHKIRRIHLKRNTESKEELNKEMEEAMHLRNTLGEETLTESETDDDFKALRIR